jgi:iron(III) transport system permease protein
MASSGEPVLAVRRFLSRAARPPASVGTLIGVGALLAVVAYLLLPPLGTLVLGAITDSPPATPLHFTPATLRLAYGQADIYPALVNSLIFAGFTATIVLALGLGLAWIVERTDARVRLMTDLLVLAPIVMPAVLLVNGWIMLLSPRSGVINLMARDWFGLATPPFDIFSFPGMVWIAVLQELPLAFLWLWPSFRAMNPELEEAGMTCGAGILTVIRRVTLPMLRPTILGAWTIFFIYALGALSVPLLVGEPAKIFLYSTQIYRAATQMPTDLNIASAYSLLFLVVSVIGIWLHFRFTRDGDRFATIRGRAFRPRRFELGRARLGVEAAVAIVLLFVGILPFLVLLWNAFMPFPQAPSLASIHLLGLKNFTAAWDYGPAQRAFRNSLLLGAASGVAATLLGAAIAWCNMRVGRYRRLIALMDQLAATPVALPGLVVGMGLTWFYLEVPLPIYGTPIILFLAYVTLHLPYAVRICSSGLAQLHPELEEAARATGASQGVVLARIVFALVAPSLLASTLYVLLRSFREYTASIFLAGPGLEVFSVLVLDMSQSGNTNILAAYTVIVACVMLVIGVLFNRVEKKIGLR